MASPSRAVPATSDAPSRQLTALELNEDARAAASFRFLLTESDTVFFVTQWFEDTYHRALYLSPSVETLFGYTVDECLRLWGTDKIPRGHEWIHPEDSESLARYFKELRESKLPPPPVVYRIKRKDGLFIHCEVSAAWHPPPDGGRVGGLSVGTLRNVDAQYTARQARKSLLISSCFDLRIANQNMQGATSLLRDRVSVKDDSEAAFLVDAIERSCSLLTGLVDNVLVMEKLETGTVSVKYDSFCVVELLADVVRVCKMAANGGDLSATVQDGMPPRIRCEKILVSQILVNLAGNALKFCGGTPVRMSASAEARCSVCDRPRTLCVRVTDGGRGMTEEEQQRVFLPYEHAPASQGGGTGLGLHISRRLARALGGELTVVSDVVQGGCEFTLRVPCCVADKGAETRECCGYSSLAPAPVPAATPSASPTPPPPQRFSVPGLGTALTAMARNGEKATQDLELALVKDFLAHAPDMVFMSSPQGEEHSIQIHFVSDSIRNILGWDPNELRGHSCLAVIHAEDAAAHAAAIDCLLRGEEKEATVMRRMLAKDGSVRSCCMRIVGGAMEGSSAIFHVIHDVTAFEKSQAALQSFLEALAHDLRTPIHGILSAGRLLAERPTLRGDPEALFMLSALRAAATHMEETSASVTRTFMGPGYVPRPRAEDCRVVDPAEVITRVASRCCTTCGAPDDCFTFEPSASQGCILPAQVEVAADAWEMLLQSVFVCALRLAQPGAGTFHLRLCASSLGHVQSVGAAACRLRVDVVPPSGGAHGEDGPFSSFAISNNGSGLRMSQACARALGGNVSVEPLPGAPRTGPFWIRVDFLGKVAEPSDAPLTPKQPEPSAGAPRGGDTPKPEAAAESKTHSASAGASTDTHPVTLRCLVVEDHALNLLLVVKLLKRLNVESDTATNGQEGLDKLQAAFRGEPGAVKPDFVLCDVHMPVMGGCEMTRRFRAWEEETQPPGSRLPIVALTANVLESQVQETKAAGMCEHLTKPLRPEAVEQLIAKYADVKVKAAKPG